MPVTPDVRRRLAVIQREWQRVDPKYLDDDEQRFWASIAGRQIRFEERTQFVEKLTTGRATKGALEQFLATAAAENPNRRLRMMALADRVSMRVERADFDDLVTLVTSAPTWDKDRLAGIRVLLRAMGEGNVDAPDQILARWTWRLARAARKVLDRKASQEYPEAKRLLGALANSRGHRHEENAAKLVNTALELPRPVGAALLASAEAYTPRANKLLDAARERLGASRRSRSRSPRTCRSRRHSPRASGAGAGARRRRRRRRSSSRRRTGSPSRSRFPSRRGVATRAGRWTRPVPRCPSRARAGSA